MNIINKILLRLVLLPSALYEKWGVNSLHLRAILQAKLLMDDRRPNTFHQMNRRAQKAPVKYATLGTMLMATLTGCLFLLSFSVSKSGTTQFTIYFSFYITILASILIADFTNVLIDVRDNYIILPKPVNDKTFVSARLFHIVIHVTKIVFPMVLPAIIFIAYNDDVLGLLPFLLLALLATLFTIFLINACYLVVLKITTPARFQSIISYLQIFFAILFYAGFQLVPRLINFAALEKYNVEEHPVFFLLPSYWFAAGLQQLYTWNNSLASWIGLLLSITVPLLSIWIVIKYFAPSFNQKLSMIGSGVSKSLKGQQKIKYKGNISYSQALAKLLTRKGPERMSFIFTWKMMLRSRDFRMKVYPTFGYLIVIIVVMFVNNKGSFLNDVAKQNNNGIITVLMVLYFSNVLSLAGLTQLTKHEKYRAAWIFFIVPIAKPGKILSGSAKAAVMQFYIPFAVIIAVAFVLIAGVKISPNIFLGFTNEFLIMSVSSYLTLNRFPFSMPQSASAGSNFLRLFMAMIFSGILAVLHFLIYKITPVVIILTVLSAVAAWYVFEAVNNYSWARIYSKYME